LSFAKILAGSDFQQLASSDEAGGSAINLAHVPPVEASRRHVLPLLRETVGIFDFSDSRDRIDEAST